MKFDCGESYKDRETRLSEWHDFYAIFPTRVGPRDCRCFETIQRKGKRYISAYAGKHYWLWEYRAK